MQPELQRFEFSDEVIQRFRNQKEIPVHFYNSKGQILIYQKDDISEKEIDGLLRFVDQGIYFRTDDMEKLGLKPRQIPKGLSDTVVVGSELVDALARDTVEVYDHMRTAAVTSIHTQKMRQRIGELFRAFEAQPDAMVGLIDTLDLMKDVPEHEVEIAVKRTVIAMAMKTRGMQAQSYKDPAMLYEVTVVLMMSALLCDIGYTRMSIPRGRSIDPKQLIKLRQHPFMSYLLLAHTDLDPAIKRNILCQHRPLRQGVVGNNFPDLNWLTGQLNLLSEKYANMPDKAFITADMEKQVNLLQGENAYDEDANILALSSEFASLTTSVPWREAVAPDLAVRMIINNSFLTYTPRILREFMDYTAISLCDNQLILQGGDFVVVVVEPADGRLYFEICRINYVDRFQSKPVVQRIASAVPNIEKVPHLHIRGWRSIRKARPAHYDLGRDSSRSIMHVICERTYPELFEEVRAMAGPWP